MTINRNLKKAGHGIMTTVAAAWLIWISSGMVEMKEGIASLTKAVEMHLKETKPAKLTAALSGTKPATP